MKLFIYVFEMKLVNNISSYIFLGSIDPIKAAKALLENGNISQDVVLLFDEMYLQKCEEYVGGKSYGVDDSGTMQKGILCFMIVGLQDNVPYVIHSVPESKINGGLLKG